MQWKRANKIPAALVLIICIAISLSAEARRGRRVAIDQDPSGSVSGTWDAEVTHDFTSNPENWLPPIELPDSMVLSVGDKWFKYVWINKNGFVSLSETSSSTPVSFSSLTSKLDAINGDVIAPFYSDIKVRSPLNLTCFPPGSSWNICDVSYAILNLTDDPPDDPLDPELALRVTWGYFGNDDSEDPSPDPADRPGVVPNIPGVDETKRNSFQMKLLDRQRQTSHQGDFDIEFNYGIIPRGAIADGPSINWEGSPTLIGMKSGSLVLDFSKFYPTSFLDSTPDVADSGREDCVNLPNPDSYPSFSKAVPLACNLITIEFRGGKANLKTYTSDLTATLASGTGIAHTTDVVPLTLTIFNTGTDNATKVRARTLLPADSSLISASPASANCSQTGQNVDCLLETLIATQNTVITLNVTSTQTGQHTFSSTIDADQFDPETADNTSDVLRELEASADLSFTACNGPGGVKKGRTATITCTVLNNGPQPAANVKLQVTLPAAVAFSSSASCAAAAKVVTCPGGSLASNASTSFSFAVLAETEGTASLPMSVQSDTFDPASNNSAVVNFTVSDEGGGGLVAPSSLMGLLLLQLIAMRRRLLAKD